MHELKKVFFNKKILIYGLGLSGKSSFNFLQKKNDVRVYDDNNIQLKKFKKNTIKKIQILNSKFDYIVISPGIDSKKCGLKYFLQDNKDKICTDLDIFYTHNYQNKIITITGTNGKSTTVKLLGDILKKSGKDTRSVGNIGRSILNERKINKKTIFVIEASSYQIEYSKFFKSKYSILLNISQDHIERHGNFKNYLQAKLKLFYQSSKKDFIFFNKKNLIINAAIKKNKIKSKIYHVDKKVTKKYLKNIKNKYFLNQNNLENLSFIFKICEILKIKTSTVIKSINSFKGLNFRQQTVYNSKKIMIINDSKSTSFSSTVNLLKSYNNIFWLVGGQPKKSDKFNFRKNNKLNIQGYIFGKNRNFYIKKLKGKIKYKIFPSIKKAYQKALFDINQSNISSKKVILFSPCSASFDEFKNFEERGAYFNLLVKKYKIKL